MASPSGNIHLPPLSTATPPKSRKSLSKTYDNRSPEWYWKLSAILPPLWIRDSAYLQHRHDIVTEMEQAWLRYQTLNIPGKGDGAGVMARSRSWRKKLEEEYSKLDPEIRRAKEVALARYEWFVIRGTDGSLDYHTEEVSKDSEGKGAPRGVGSMLKRVLSD